MSKHSTLTNQEDLHYAKLRAITGDINLVSPDFVDQILASTDTNKIYRASGTSAGDLIELLSTPLPPVSVANEWIPITPDLSLQAGKSYLNQLNYEFFVSLPLDATSGQSINIFSLDGNVLLNTKGLPILRAGTSYLSPSTGSGVLSAYRVEPRMMCQLSFDSILNAWIMTQGDLTFGEYIRGGCTDLAADNYDSLATEEDGSCLYS